MSETPTDNLLDRLRAAAADSGMSRVAIARAAGLHSNTLHGFNSSRPSKRPWNPTLATLKALEQVLFPTQETQRQPQQPTG